MTDCVGTAHILNVVLAVITVKSVYCWKTQLFLLGLFFMPKHYLKNENFYEANKIWVPKDSVSI